MTAGDSDGEVPPWHDLRDSPPPEPPEPASPALTGQTPGRQTMAGRAMAGRALAGRALAGRALASRRLALTGHRPELDPPRRLESAPGRRPQVAELERGQKPAPAQAGTDPAPRREDGPAHSAPARRRGWLVPFASGALTMVVLAAAVVGSVALLHHNHSPRKHAPAKPRAAQAAPMPAQMPSSALFQAL